MGEAAIRPRTRLPSGRGRGFTLIEVLVVVAIVGILAAIALPSYSDYIRRSKIIEATSALSDMRTRYEQFFLDNRTYAGGCAAIQPIVAPLAKSFTVDCTTVAESATTYTGTATGKASEGMNGFVYTIDYTNTKVTTSTGPWGKSSGSCWVTRKDGSCT
jgi:type IV pilus assembly protein PilE